MSCVISDIVDLYLLFASPLLRGNILASCCRHHSHYGWLLPVGLFNQLLGDTFLVALFC
jgi:hypothetical protein